MIKILHTADWHLDAPMSGHTPEGTEYLQRELKKLPKKIVKLATAENCDLILISGDLFDDSSHSESLSLVQNAFGQTGIPIVIAPGNHDYINPSSPYMAEGWPENVHIFRSCAIESFVPAGLDCCIYGAGYQSMDCPALLKNFYADAPQAWKIGVLHAEADTLTSPYCPITKEQIKNSGLDYLALGHIHKGSSLRADKTLCAWPGSPMGHGFDELGAKGVILVNLDQQVIASFLPLDTPRFYDEEVDAVNDPQEAVAAVLPTLPTDDFYRITLTGYQNDVDLGSLYAAFAHIPNLTLRDQTLPAPDLWDTAEEDSLEGTLFALLKTAAESDSSALAQRAQLAARICRQLLDGQEVKLP